MGSLFGTLAREGINLVVVLVLLILKIVLFGLEFKILVLNVLVQRLREQVVYFLGQIYLRHLQL